MGSLRDGAIDEAWGLDPLDANHPMQKIRRGEREEMYESLVLHDLPNVYVPEPFMPIVKLPKDGYDMLGIPRPSDPTNPKHYSSLAIEPLDFILANNIGYPEGNVIKYVCRWKQKGGIEDLKKARTYLDKYIAHLEQTEAKK